MNLDDLPAGPLRDRVLRAAQRDLSGPTGSRGEAAGVRRARGRARNRYRCAACSTVSTSYAAAERHADAAGHCRIDLELEAVR